MKKLLVAFVLMLVAATPSLAAIEVTGGAYVGAFDKYLWRGFDLSGSEPVAQGGMDMSVGDFTLSYWTNVQLSSDPGEGYASGEGNETDITLNYAVPVGEAVSVNLGNIYYTLDGYPDTNELYLGVTANTILSPTVKAYYDYDEFKDDRFYTVSVGHGFEIAGLTLNLGALASYADNNSANEPWNAEFTAGLDIPVTEQLVVKPTFLYSTPLGDDAKEAIDDETAAGLTVAFSF